MITIYLSAYTDDDPKTIPVTEHQLGRRLLSFALEDCWNITMSCEDLEKELSHGSYGKPLLNSLPHIHFNISHCKNLVACAVSDAPIGIDAENIRPFRDKILRKVLTASEQVLLNDPSLTIQQRNELFFRFWTLKESRIKQSGTGMAVPLTDFSFIPDMTQSFHRPNSSIPELSFCQWKLDSGHILSVCTSDQDIIPEIRLLQSGTCASW